MYTQQLSSDSSTNSNSEEDVIGNDAKVEISKEQNRIGKYEKVHKTIIGDHEVIIIYIIIYIKIIKHVDKPCLRQSQFSNIPPTINFMLPSEIPCQGFHTDIKHHLKWKLSKISPSPVRACVRLF